jgi:hypothetical protein
MDLYVRAKVRALAERLHATAQPSVDELRKATISMSTPCRCTSKRPQLRKSAELTVMWKGNSSGAQSSRVASTSSAAPAESTASSSQSCSGDVASSVCGTPRNSPFLPLRTRSPHSTMLLTTRCEARSSVERSPKTSDNRSCIWASVKSPCTVRSRPTFDAVAPNTGKASRDIPQCSHR